MNEQANLEPRARMVNNAMDAAEAIIDQELTKDIKIKYRKPLVMDEPEIHQFLEMLAEAIYQGVGKARTGKFDLEKIYQLYPPSRIHFDFTGLVHEPQFEDIVDELANLKA